VIPQLALAPDYSISRLIKGGWHLAGGHGAVDPAQATRDMATFVDTGVTAFDCADIYTGVEELIGRFRREYPSHAKRIRVHTKFVPDLDKLATVDRAYVEQIVDRSLARLGQERLDLVQFHWWDYEVPRWVEIALELDRLRRAGKIDRIGVTNFGTPELRAIVEAGVPVFAHQLQYSVLDDRPEHGMVEFCRAHGIALLCYGTVAGGLLSDRWLGQPAPAEPLANRSLVKYRLIVDEFGDWAAFQRLLATLKAIGDRHGVDVATVATRAVLERPGVAAAIVGATNASHLPSHARIGDFALDAQDRATLDAVLAQRSGPAGDVYTLERDREGPHGRIMKYTLNR
jgi:aryl-alcohol dehydrogenase-like predicted oxidoreductase